MTYLAASYVIVGLTILGLTYAAVSVVGVIPRALVAFAAFPEALLGLALLLSVVHFLIAYGLWTLRSWARIAVIGFSIIGFGIGMLTLPLGVAAMVLNTVNVSYLTGPRVRAAFDARAKRRRRHRNR